MPVWIFMLEVFGRDKSAFFDVPVCHPNADSNAVCGKSNGDRTGNVHSASFDDHRADRKYEGRKLLKRNFLDKS